MEIDNIEQRRDRANNACFLCPERVLGRTNVLRKIIKRLRLEFLILEKGPRVLYFSRETNSFTETKVSTPTGPESSVMNTLDRLWSF